MREEWRETYKAGTLAVAFCKTVVAVLLELMKTAPMCRKPRGITFSAARRISDRIKNNPRPEMWVHFTRCLRVFGHTSAAHIFSSNIHDYGISVKESHDDLVCDDNEE